MDKIRVILVSLGIALAAISELPVFASSWTDSGAAEGRDGDFAESRFGSHPERRPSSMPSKAIISFTDLDGDPDDLSTRPARSLASLSGDARKKVKLTDSGTQLSARSQAVQEVSLIAGDLGFFPKTIFVNRDVPVRLFVTGASKHTLCMMMDSFQIRKQVRSGKIEELGFTPSEPGQYRFYCPVNGMEGTLVVRDLQTRASSGN